MWDAVEVSLSKPIIEFFKDYNDRHPLWIAGRTPPAAAVNDILPRKQSSLDLFLCLGAAILPCFVLKGSKLSGRIHEADIRLFVVQSVDSSTITSMYSCCRGEENPKYFVVKEVWGGGWRGEGEGPWVLSGKVCSTGLPKFTTFSAKWVYFARVNPLRQWWQMMAKITTHTASVRKTRPLCMRGNPITTPGIIVDLVTDNH